VVLSSDDLADDVLTLPEESIVLTESAEDTGSETRWDNDAVPDAQPMTTQDAHHPQEELVSHD